MKPDAHKQKQSQKYKKKHAIATQNTVKENGNDNRTSKNLKHSSESKNENGNNEDDSVDELDTSTKLFKKREIISNWSRYETPIEEVTDEEFHRTKADYSELVSVSSDVLSQFRFKDELSWEDNDSDMLIEDFMTYDLAGLSQALKCIPLHKRLDIDENLFTNEQIKTFNNEAQKLREHLYSATGKHEQRTRMLLKDDEDEEEVNLLDNQNLDQIIELPSSDDTPTEDDTLDAVLSNSDLNQVNDESLNQLFQNETKNSTILEKNHDVNINVGMSHEVDLEHDLDNLLSLDTSKSRDSDNDVSGISQNSEIGQTTDVVPETVLLEHAIPKQPEVFKPCTTENLEDWLDNLLD